MIAPRWFRLVLTLVLGLAMPAQGVLACTSFTLASADGGRVYGRTMEFGLALRSQFIVVPHKLSLVGTGPDGAPGSGLAWTTKYGIVGTNGLDLPVVIDGVNEAGLGGGLLFFPGAALFQDVPQTEAKNSIASYELLLYTLSSFATVAEVKAGLPKIMVNRSLQVVFKAPGPLHMTLHDAQGNSLVVEYIGGALKMYDNPGSVMTNAPAFDWHMTNLANYLNVSDQQPPNRALSGLVLTPPSSGSGMLGLPGDMSSPARFVRAFFFTGTAPPSATTEAAVNNAFHVLNNFDIPPGTIRTSAGNQAGGGVDGYEVTEWMAVSDLTHRRFYLRSYGNSQTRMIDLNRAGMDGKTIRLIPISDTPAVQDVSQ